jgi:hypothetical protein
MTLLIRAAVAATLLHITPTVILVSRPEAATRLIPGAEHYFAREVHLSDADAHRLHQAVDWSPEDGVVTFYVGKRGVGATVAGTMEFVRVDSPHGPLEVAVGFDAAGAIRAVEVTKATVETKPWVLEALRAGLLATYVGLKQGGAPAGAAAIRGQAGALPVYMAEQVDKGVARALAAYAAFYR